MKQFSGGAGRRCRMAPLWEAADDRPSHETTPMTDSEPTLEGPPPTTHRPRCSGLAPQADPTANPFGTAPTATGPSTASSFAAPAPTTPPATSPFDTAAAFAA